MKTIFTILLTISSVLCHSQIVKSHYKTDIDFGNGTVFSTFLDVDIKKNKFKITSPKNADVRMFGGKAKIGRLMGKSPKKGIIINIDGNIINDSLVGQTKIPVFGKLDFKGVVKNNTITGVFVKTGNGDVGSINGIISNEKNNNYNYLNQKIIDTIQNNIYSKTALETDEWKSFQKEVNNLCNLAYDDIELFLGFNLLTKKLPFTHLSLYITRDQKITPNEEETSEESNTISDYKSVIFEEKNSATAYINIKNFSNSKDELATIFPKIVANQNYKNLIIDLRSNGGGGLDPAFEFAKYITTKDLEVGYFVTNKFKYTHFDNQLFNNLPILQPKNNEQFTQDLKTTNGLKMVFKKPTTPVFKGNIYVLTSDKTASTCEPIVYALKNNKIATIIGEKTYGGMLAGCPFVVSGKYTIILPIADFYTFDGIRLDKVGVTPDIEVKSEEALEKALELINNDKKN